MLFSPRNPARDRRQRFGKSALNSLMRDPRYFDGNHKEHSAMVDLVRRGFELVYDEPDDADDLSPAGPKPLAQKRGRTILTGARLARPFADAIARLARQTEKADSMPEADREVLGRRALLTALKSTRAAFPSGFDEELRALSRPDLRSAGPSPGPSTPPPPDAKPEKPKKPQESEPEKKPENPEKPDPDEKEDQCEALRQEMVARNEAQDQILAEVGQLSRELISLNEERSGGMRSVNDEDRRAGRIPNPGDIDFSGFEKDTPEAQRRRGGRLPKSGIDWMAARGILSRFQGTSETRARRGKEIYDRIWEIKARLNELHDANRVADREAQQAQSRFAACKAHLGRE